MCYVFFHFAAAACGIGPVAEGEERVYGVSGLEMEFNIR